MRVSLSLSVLLLFAAGCGKIASPFDEAHKHADDAVQTQTQPPPQTAEDCSASTVRQMTRPYDASANSPTFTYAYEYIAPAAGAPTVVYIPGGPGQTAIGTAADWTSKLPAGYGLLLTDPRGVGCNANPDDPDGAFPAGFYRSDLVASDVVAAVGDAGVSNYLLYGISYGTVVATIAGSQAEAAAKAGGKTPAAKAVVLEGVMGRAETADESNGTYIQIWNDVVTKNNALAKFQADPLPLGYTAHDWEQVIQLGAMVGEIDSAGTTLASQGPTVNLLDLLVGDAVSDDTDRQAWAKKTIDKLISQPTLDSSIKGTDTFYAYIACQEIWENPSGTSLQNGQLVPNEGNLCSSVGLSLTNPFDAAKWPVAAPVYYVEGSADPATPVVVARYHFDNEPTSTGRAMALVGGGGHNSFELSLSDCYQGAWQAMAAGTGFSDAVAACKWVGGVDLLTVVGGATKDTKLGH